MKLYEILDKHSDLSLKAMGLLTYFYVYGLNDNSKNALYEKLSDGRTSIDTAFNELVNKKIVLINKDRVNGQYNFIYLWG